MITRVELDVGVDPGHGGFSFSYMVERRGAEFRVRAVLRKDYPPPSSMEKLPPTLDEALEEDSAEVEAFLQALLEHHDVFALGDLETLTVMLHPTFFRFRFADESGRSNEFRYRIECGHHLDAPHAKLVRAFEDFFDKARLVERFREHAVPRTLRPPRPWWRFWSRG